MPEDARDREKYEIRLEREMGPVGIAACRIQKILEITIY